jgi:hypothetical protein
MILSRERLSMAMDEKLERLLQKYYEKDYYDYREDLVAELGDLNDDAMEIALEARVSKMFPLVDSIGHQLDLTRTYRSRRSFWPSST